MTTLRQAVERAREHEGWPPSGNLSVEDLMHHFQPSHPGSVRSLLAAMNDRAAVRHPWAVILCRFKGSAPDPALEDPIKAFFEEAFTPGAGGLIEYWRDVSLGSIDITGSRVFDWLEVAIPRSSAGGWAKSVPPGIGRQGLIDAGVAAATIKHPEVTTGFYSQICVYTQNWSKDDPSLGQADVGGPFWIDGSADPRGKVNLTPPFNGNITAHEMGHGFDMAHDIGADLITNYADPSCIMSQNGPFIHPAFGVAFGPAVCLPHLVQRGWMYTHRLYHDDGAWLDQPDGITLPLAPNTRPGAHANQGIKLSYAGPSGSWDYYLEYVIPTEWDQGVVGAPYVFVRRIASVAGVDRAVYLGAMHLPTVRGATAEFLEPSGQVRFRAELTDLEGPVASVNARRA